MLFINTSKKVTLDLKKITDWYEEKSPGLGERFMKTMDTKVKRMASHPHEFMFVSRNVQRAQLKKFPYDIYFAQEQNSIVILRVRHKKQRPIKRFR